MPRIGKTIDDVIRGDSRTIHCYFKDSSGNALNLAGGTVYFTVQSTSDPADDVASLKFQRTATDATPFTSPSTGLHTFVLTPANTNIDPDTYHYDCQLTDSSGNKLSSYRGKFVVQSDITRT